jgi:hypothetical protein
MYSAGLFTEGVLLKVLAILQAPKSSAAVFFQNGPRETAMKLNKEGTE